MVANAGRTACSQRGILETRGGGSADRSDSAGAVTSALDSTILGWLKDALMVSLSMINNRAAPNENVAEPGVVSVCVFVA